MYKKNLTNKLDVRVSDKIYNALCDIAKSRNISISELIRYILMEYTIKH